MGREGCVSEDGRTDPSRQRLAELEWRAMSGGPQAEEALRALAELAADRALSREASKELRRILYRLRSRGIHVTGPAAGASPSAPGGAGAPGGPGAVPVRAAASGIGVDGTAALGVVWEIRGALLLTLAVVGDGRGLEAFEAERVSRREAAEALERPELELRPLEARWGARMLSGALHGARRAGGGLPREFAVVRQELEPALPPGEAGPFGWAKEAWSADLRAAVADPQRVELWARASAPLMETGEVDWDLGEALGPWVDEARRHRESRVVLLEATRRSTEERLTRHVADALHAPPLRERLAARLAYVALRLERAGDVQGARLAAAACTALWEGREGVRVGVLEALASRHLAPYFSRSDAAGGGPAGALRRSPSGLVLPPVSDRLREGS